MKYNYNKRAIRAFLSGIGLGCSIAVLMSGCVKNDDLFAPEEGTIYLPAALQDRATMSLYKADSSQHVTFGAYYAGLSGPSSDVTVEFQVDPSLVAKYNLDNAHLGNTYYALPDSLYKLSSNTAVIKAGKHSSDPLSIIVEGKKLSFGYRYLLPIKITNISSGIKDSALSVAYFKLDSVLTRVNDVTSLATLTVSSENRNGANSNEGSPKLVDNNYSSKFLTFSYTSDFWAQLKFSSPETLDAYQITSGDDAPERDPKDWKFQGSNNGTDWVTLDDKKGEIFLGRQLTRRFNLQSPATYSHYRLAITANGGVELMQITEWRLLRFF